MSKFWLISTVLQISLTLALSAFLSVPSLSPIKYTGLRAGSQPLIHGTSSSTLRRPKLLLCSASGGAASGPSGVETKKTFLKYGGLQHAGVLVSDTSEALKFYIEVLGMTDVSHLRPPLEYPGAFVACGADQIHLMQLPSPDPREGRPVHGGRDRHIAVTISNLDPLSLRLTENGIPFTMSKSGRRALFCRDRDSNAIEFVEDTSI
jgi:glyoxylase I family protein